MFFLDKLLNKNKKAVKTPETRPEETFDQKKMDQIVTYLKINSSESCVRIDATPSDSLNIFDSKFGGLPYWDKSLEYPKDHDGKRLVLLAQINFATAGIQNELLPKDGILQFYIAPGDLYGADFKNRDLQDGFRVIYHSNVNREIKEDEILSLGILPNTDPSLSSEYLPFFKQYSLCFREDKDCVNGMMEGYDEKIRSAVKELFDEDIVGNVAEAFSRKEYDYLFNKTGWGHKMLGYPSFTQCDPREKGDHETLLLQIDSKDGIVWGDTGIANFFIDAKKLRNCDFSDVFYTWDCY